MLVGPVSVAVNHAFTLEDLDQRLKCSSVLGGILVFFARNSSQPAYNPGHGGMRRG